MNQASSIAVIAPGPSASRTWSNAESYGEVIAIDRAALLVDRPCWWVCGSPEVYLATASQVEPRGARLIASFGTIAVLLDRLRGVALDRFVALSRPLSLESFTAGVAAFDSSTAISIGYQFGGRRLDLFGFDLCGERAFDGSPLVGDTSLERWAQERWQVGSLARYLRGRGAFIRWVEFNAEPAWSDEAWGEFIREDRQVSDVESCRAELWGASV